jgi:hypothetical protein
VARTPNPGDALGFVDAVLAVLLVDAGLGVWAVLNLTSASPENDPFDSPYYWWT